MEREWSRVRAVASVCECVRAFLFASARMWVYTNAGFSLTGCSWHYVTMILRDAALHGVVGASPCYVPRHAYSGQAFARKRIEVGKAKARGRDRREVEAIKEIERLTGPLEAARTIGSASP
eukprot:6185370-Pleurochrysis_carterae.AAC.1